MRDITPIKRKMDTFESRALWKRGKLPELIPRYEVSNNELIVKHKSLRAKIVSLLEKYKKLEEQASIVWKKQQELLQQMQSKCDHEYVLERKTSWRDEYDSWHDGYPERKCIDCFLVEKSNCDDYQKLANSTVIELIMNQGDKVFSLEFEDLNP